MLVAGSQVTLTAQQTLNGGLAGRFGKTRIGPLTPEAGMELALRLARHYDLPLTARLAYEVSRLAGGHPYYIERALLSAAPDKDLTTPEGLAAVFDYEVREGRIRAFWSEHFEDTLEALGGEEARRLLFYVLQWERETPAEEQRQWGGCEAARAAESLGLEPEVAYALLRKLARADVLIEDPAHGLFHSFRDEILERCLRLEYEWQIRGLAQERMRALVQEELQQQVAELEQEVRSLRGRLNETLGREAEVTVQRLMKQGFRNQQIGGPIFHVAGKVRLPEFLWVKPDRVVGNGLEEYQLDNVGMPVRPDRDPVWITEQKNWAKPVSLADVRKFARTVAVYCRDRNIAKSVAWLYGRSGFTAAAHKFMEQEGILYSDLDNLLVLAEKLGLLGL
jgi:hypothetical protein